MVDHAAIQAIADKIVAEFKPERIVLFGSRANGSPDAESDIDLLVILPFDGAPYLTSAKIRARLRPDVPLDVIARTPADAQRLYAIGDPIIRAALNNGRDLYRAAA